MKLILILGFYKKAKKENPNLAKSSQEENNTKQRKARGRVCVEDQDY